MLYSTTGRILLYRLFCGIILKKSQKIIEATNDVAKEIMIVSITPPYSLQVSASFFSKYIVDCISLKISICRFLKSFAITASRQNIFLLVLQNLTNIIQQICEHFYVSAAFRLPFYYCCSSSFSITFSSSLSTKMS